MFDQNARDRYSRNLYTPPSSRSIAQLYPRRIRRRHRKKYPTGATNTSQARPHTDTGIHAESNPQFTPYPIRARMVRSTEGHKAMTSRSLALMVSPYHHQPYQRASTAEEKSPSRPLQPFATITLNNYHIMKPSPYATIALCNDPLMQRRPYATITLCNHHVM